MLNSEQLQADHKDGREDPRVDQNTSCHTREDISVHVFIQVTELHATRNIRL